MLLVIEGMAMCLIMLLTCVVGIAKDGPVGLVTFYEKEVQDRVVALGLTTKDKIRKSAIISGIVVFLPMLIFIPAMVYGLNGARGFTQGFLQMLAIGMIYGLFLYRKEISWQRVAAAHFVRTVVVSFLLNPLWLSLLYGYGFWAVITARFVKTVIMFPIETALLYFILRPAREFSQRS